MKIRKSFFLKVIVFLCSTILAFYAFFVAISNITSDNNIFNNFRFTDRNIMSNFQQQENPSIPTNPEFRQPEYGGTGDMNDYTFRPPSEKTKSETDTSEKSDSELLNQEFSKSVAGNLVWVVVA